MAKLFSMLGVVALVLGMFAPVALADNHVDMAKVRVLHASPDAPAVDVYVNDEAVVEGAAFKDATDYLELPAGDHTVDIYAEGTMEEEDPVLSTDVSVEGGQAYTVAAVNTVDSLQLEAFEDTMEAEEGMAKLRVGHLIPDGPAVDVGEIEGDAIFSGAEFPSATDYEDVEAGTYDLEVRTQEGDQLIDLSGTEVEEGNVYSAFAVGTADSPEILLLQDNQEMPSEMPATGFGGASESATNAVLYASILGAIAMGAGFILFRKRQEA
ncbi:cell wall anchor [Halobacillus andaensis]|uniref:Cell wall anchor n=1 Tax=Halobacillus andaensis TaxID=1176239 RepID=A0A917EVQ5_HALAA|nr:DUF4397 domain-containing protein [Halobacillus andaensis]MBP2006153.1 hypothetical protein [Halobacillus andaensis]GGF23275.1 cell wall anchor [Halobacillus andaensis]